MANRIFVVEQCSKCPHYAHGGGFGTVMYTPLCNLLKQSLPHTVEVYNRTRVIAVMPPGVPDVCPLPVAEQKAEVLNG